MHSHENPLLRAYTDTGGNTWIMKHDPFDFSDTDLLSSEAYRRIAMAKRKRLGDIKGFQKMPTADPSSDTLTFSPFRLTTSLQLASAQNGNESQSNIELRREKKETHKDVKPVEVKIEEEQVEKVPKRRKIEVPDSTIPSDSKVHLLRTPERKTSCTINRIRRTTTPEKPNASRFIVSSPGHVHHQQQQQQQSLTPPHNLREMLKMGSSKPNAWSPEKQLSMAVEQELARFRQNKEKKAREFQEEVRKGLSPFRGRRLFPECEIEMEGAHEE